MALVIASPTERLPTARQSPARCEPMITSQPVVSLVVANFVDDAAFERPSPPLLLTWQLTLEPDYAVVGIVASLQPITRRYFEPSQLAPRWPRCVSWWSARATYPKSWARWRHSWASPRSFASHDWNRTPSFHFLFDVSALCSVSEGFPNSLVEAMAGRTTNMVAARVGGGPRLVQKISRFDPAWT